METVKNKLIFTITSQNHNTLTIKYVIPTIVTFSFLASIFVD